MTFDPKRLLPGTKSSCSTEDTQRLKALDLGFTENKSYSMFFPTCSVSIEPYMERRRNMRKRRKKRKREKKRKYA